MLDLILIFGDLVNVSFLFLYSNELNQLDVFWKLFPWQLLLVQNAPNLNC